MQPERLIQLPVAPLQKVLPQQRLHIGRLAVQRFTDIHIPQLDQMLLKSEREAPYIGRRRTLCGADAHHLRLVPFNVRQPCAPDGAERRIGMPGIDPRLKAPPRIRRENDGTLLAVGISRRAVPFRRADRQRAVFRGIAPAVPGDHKTGCCAGCRRPTALLNGPADGRVDGFDDVPVVFRDIALQVDDDQRGIFHVMLLRVRVLTPHPGQRRRSGWGFGAFAIRTVSARSAEGLRQCRAIRIIRCIS